MQGLHLTADLYACNTAAALWVDAEQLRQTCCRLVEASGLTIVAEKFHTYPDFNGQPSGITGVVLLAESHLAIHTWPEQGNVTLDVYVCNFSEDNSAKAETLLNSLIAVFAPQTQQINRLHRGKVIDATGENPSN